VIGNEPVEARPPTAGGYWGRPPILRFRQSIGKRKMGERPPFSKSGEEVRLCGLTPRYPFWDIRAIFWNHFWEE
jgi:hypothetical protein